MPKRNKQYHFTTVLSSIDGIFMKTAIFIPQEVVRELPPGRLRVKGTCNGVPFSLGIQYRKGGTRYLSVSAGMRKAAGIKEGDKVDIVFRLVDPDQLEVPEELEAVLEQDDTARKAWEKFTTGYQRSLIHYVTSAKSVDVRIARSIDLLERAKAGLLHGQRKKSNRE